MLIKEYRITLPMSVDEYRIGQLYTTCRMSKSESGGGEGVEILKGEEFYGKKLFGEFDSGIYTSKMYFLKEKLPLFVRLMAPDSCVELREESWDAFPYCRTTLTNEEMRKNFFVLVESIHLEGKDEENAHKLEDCRLRRREVVDIDIANDPVLYEDYDPTLDPSCDPNRPLGRNWKENCPKMMTSYKLITCSFEWFGLEEKVENLVHKIAKRLFLVFHRKMYSWMDEWKGLSMEEIRDLEARTAVHLTDRRAATYLQGMKFR